MHSTDIKALDNRCRDHWTYRINDTAKWRSYGDEVLARQPWFGDCTDLVSTVFDLMGRQGVPLKVRWRLLVVAQDTSEVAPNHMVGAVLDDDGEWWIVGDTYGGTYHATSLLHRPVCFNRLDETLPVTHEAVWREGVPWVKADH